MFHILSERAFCLLARGLEGPSEDSFSPVNTVGSDLKWRSAISLELQLNLFSVMSFSILIRRGCAAAFSGFLTWSCRSVTWSLPPYFVHRDASRELKAVIKSRNDLMFRSTRMDTLPCCPKVSRFTFLSFQVCTECVRSVHGVTIVSRCGEFSKNGLEVLERFAYGSEKPLCMSGVT